MSKDHISPEKIQAISRLIEALCERCYEYGQKHDRSKVVSDFSDTMLEVVKIIYREG